MKEFKGTITQVGVDVIDVSTVGGEYRAVTGRQWFVLEWDGDSKKFYSEGRVPTLGVQITITVDVP